MTHRQAAIVVIAAGVLVAIGSLLPWATVTTGFGSVSLAGTEGDGKITLILGVLAALIGFVSIEGATRARRLMAFVLGALVAVTGAYDYVTLDSRLRETASDAVRASIGPGLYLVILGAVVLGWGALALTPVALAPTSQLAPARPASTNRVAAWLGGLSLPRRIILVLAVVVLLVVVIPFMRGLLFGR